MALQDYNNFLENSLAIDSRYPTLEEFLLALGHCIPEKPSEEEKKRITDSQLGRVVISKKDIVNYLSSMKLRYDLVMMLYINVIKQSRTNIMSKNSYLHVMLFTLFVRRFNLKEYFNKDKSPLEGYSRTTGFKDFLKELVGEKNGFYYNVEMPEGDNSEYLDNLYDWLDGGVPTIGALERFLQHVALVENSPIKANRNKILVLWFFQSMSKKYPHDEKQFASKEYLDQREKNDDELEDIDNLVIGPKMPYSLADNTERIEKAKEKYSFDEYPFIAQIEIKHFIYQRRYKDALVVSRAITPLFLFLGMHEKWGWYSLILSLVAFNYVEIEKDKNEKKSLKGLFKRLYNIGGIFDIDGNILELDKKENEEIAVQKYYRKFKEWRDLQYFYEKQKEETYPFPAPDYKKVNKKKVTFGDVVNCPQLIFYTQLNEPDIVCNLLKKGAKIDASTPSNESALYWNLINLDLTAHLNFGRTTMCPPESNLLVDNKRLNDYVYARKEAYFNVLKGDNLDEDLENGYKIFVESVEEQHKDAYKIFKALLPHYQEPKGNLPLSTFHRPTLYRRTILNVAVCTGDINIISSVIDLYKKYCGEKNIDEWVNVIAEVQPRTPVFWVSRLYHYIQQTATLKKVLINCPIVDFTQLSGCDPRLIAKSWNAASPYNTNNYSENFALVQEDLASPAKTIKRNLQQYWEHRYIQEKLPENKLLAILRLLLDCHANPLVMIDGTTINCPKEFNALYHAIANGWLEGVKMMVECVKSKGKFDVDPYLKYAVLQSSQTVKPVVDYLLTIK
ncbi:hypothetical protein B7988_12175 [Fibrobacter sp. UWB1]|uniref:hypothetical protein n=1 Tax=Fibrobacter sp. UWB1 TaxID=1964355 RepID=UPI000B52452A|nr:hypothetical protein [Fibrobacter sp. UWB1]OWV25216.1 hypothetical protein B7988_12175 [Fibrobacter sp. UWB1]